MWEFKYQPGRDLIADVGIKTFPKARMTEMRKNISMGWQPCTVDAVHQEDEGIVAPRAKRLVACYNPSKATKLVVALRALQRVHGAVQEDSTNSLTPDTEEGNYILMVFGAVMLLIGMVC